MSKPEITPALLGNAIGLAVSMDSAGVTLEEALLIFGIAARVLATRAKHVAPEDVDHLVHAQFQEGFSQKVEMVPLAPASGTVH